MTGLRDPDLVMRLERLGASHQTRLSFMRVLLRQMRREGWRFDRPVWDIHADGTGRAVYRAIGPDHTYSLVAFAHDLPDEDRTDRVIAEAWDATFALFDGTPDAGDLDRLEAEVPLQEAGRVSDRELVLSRANRSVRLWDHVVDRLASGQQPDRDLVARVGYLMRTTAVYGSGKFGLADRAAIAGRGFMGGPFRAEMLAVWLIRTFVMDLVEHLAALRGGAKAARLDPDLRRLFGIGNSTGLGMAPFLVNHPALLNAWITARETALARVCALETASEKAQSDFDRAFRRARSGVAGWTCDQTGYMARVTGLRADCEKIAWKLAEGALSQRQPWQSMMDWAADALTVEGQEFLASLVLEPYGDLVDDLAGEMAADEVAGFFIDGSWSVAQLRDMLTVRYSWAFRFDPADRGDTARFWYVSESKLEPRLGERHEEPWSELEQPLDIARRAAALAQALDGWPDDAPIAEFLAREPRHRRMIRRVQISAAAPYAELRDNLTSCDLVPVDMLRCKLSFFGATRFDPRSDRWVRITMFQNAPFPDELHATAEDDWVYPLPVEAAE